MSHHVFFPFGFIFFILFAGFFITRVIAFRRYGGSRFCGSESAMELLKKRLVNGEINEEDYHRIKNALKK